MGAGIPGPADRPGLAEAARRHDQDLPRARAAPGRSARAPRGRRRLLGVDRRRRAVSGQQPPGPPALGSLSRPLSPQDPDGRRGGALARHPHRARRPPGPPHRQREGLRARGAGRGLLPADGDPRRAGDALHRLQHRAVGLHQQRLGRDGLGPRVHQPQHRCHHDDLRLHAALRRPRAPRREHAGPEWAVRLVAGRDGAQHPRGIGRGGFRWHGARDGRGRTGAARGGQRQVGGPLEDGAHRPARLGEGGRRQPAGPPVSTPQPHAGGCRRA